MGIEETAGLPCLHARCLGVSRDSYPGCWAGDKPKRLLRGKAGGHGGIPAEEHRQAHNVGDVGQAGGFVGQLFSRAVQPLFRNDSGEIYRPHENERSGQAAFGNPPADQMHRATSRIHSAGQFSSFISLLPQNNSAGFPKAEFFLGAPFGIPKTGFKIILTSNRIQCIHCIMVEISVKEEAYRQIRNRLLEGGFQMGQRISDLALSEELGISRTPVREAMSQLQSEGFFENIPHVGTFVRKLDRDELGELFDIREALEGYAAGLAAQRISQADLCTLEDACRQNRQLCVEAREVTDPQAAGELHRRAVRLDLNFHRLIVEAAGNRYLAKAITDYKVLVNIMSLEQGKLRYRYTLAETYKGHVRIYQALREHNADRARRLAAEHVASAKAQLLHRYDTNNVENPVSSSPELQRMLAKMEKYLPR